MPKPGDVIITKPEPWCPECGAKMTLRRPKPEGKQFDPFWGCSRYPDCRGTRNINPNTGEAELTDDEIDDIFNPPLYGR